MRIHVKDIYNMKLEDRIARRWFRKKVELKFRNKNRCMKSSKDRKYKMQTKTKVRL